MQNFNLPFRIRYVCDFALLCHFLLLFVCLFAPSICLIVFRTDFFLPRNLRARFTCDFQAFILLISSLPSQPQSFSSVFNPFDVLNFKYIFLMQSIARHFMAFHLSFSLILYVRIFHSVRILALLKRKKYVKYLCMHASQRKLADMNEVEPNLFGH